MGLVANVAGGCAGWNGKCPLLFLLLSLCAFKLGTAKAADVVTASGEGENVLVGETVSPKGVDLKHDEGFN